MRGFLGGVSFGAVLAIAGAGTLSLMSPLPQSPDVTTDAPSEVAQPTGGENAVPGPAGVDADLVDAEPTAPEPAQSGSGDLGALNGADTDPAAPPQVGPATGGLETPDINEDAGVSAESDAPITPQAPIEAPVAPESDTAVSAQTDSAAPPTPEVEAEVEAEVAAGENAVPSATPDTDNSADSGAADGAADPIASDAPESEAVVESAPEATPEPAPEIASPGETAQNDGSGPVADDNSPQIAAPAAPAAPEIEAEDSPRIAALPQAGSDAEAGAESSPRIGTPVLPLTERDQPTAKTTPATQETEQSVPPIQAYAAVFENTGDKPLMSIVLIDGADSVGGEALLDFPYPLTFALDPLDPNAAAKMATYRAAGFEVVILADMVSGASAVDAETALEVWFNGVPESVALLEGTGSGIQANREVSDQITAVLKDDGRGMITQDRGLNTVQKLAARDGVPSGVVFRDFDGAGQTPTVMRRFLDQAAFRAGQLGEVIMLGRVQPDTISALLLWGLQDRANRVALAPVSATIQRDTP